MYCGDGLTKETTSVVLCALKIRKITFFFLEKETYLYLTEMVEWMPMDADLN